MAGEPEIVVVGNLGDDPELRETSTGQTVVNFRVAQTPRQFDKEKNEWVNQETIWWRCSAWRDHATNIASTLTKGSRVILQGRLKQQSYEDRDGNTRSQLAVDVDDIGVLIPRTTPNSQRAGGQQYRDNPQERHVGSVEPSNPESWDPEVPF